MTEPRHLVLIAGFNYPEYENPRLVDTRRRVVEYTAKPWPPKSGSWREYCLRMARLRLKHHNDLLITLFDFFQGTRERITVGPGGTLKPVPLNLVPGDDRTWPRVPVWHNYRRMVVIRTGTHDVDPDSTKLLP